MTSTDGTATMENAMAPDTTRPRRLRVYIAGPLTNPDWAQRRQNVLAAIDVARHLIVAGYAPLCPHLFDYMAKNEEIPYEMWLACDFAWLEIADAVWCIPGQSPGTEREVALARALGIPVVSSLRELHALT